MGTILIVGSGLAAFRRYIFETVSRHHTAVLLDSAPATWQQPFVADSAVADLTDPHQVLAAVDALNTRNPIEGVLTWDESLLIETAQIARHLGRPGLSLPTARACRDKALQRAAFAESGVPSARYRTVDTAEQAAAAARELGYPLVVKPRSLAGSIGVRLVHDDDELRTAYADASSATCPGFTDDAGVLVEEYLTGPEISVDSWVLDGEVVPIVLAHKIIGAPPYFQEIGHTVGPALPAELDLRVRDVVRRANLAVGADRMVTHTELMLTADGPRVVEINGRLGGDMIPYLGQLATGIDIGRVVADVALGRRPEPTNSLSRCAGVHFFHPKVEMRLEGLNVPADIEHAPWLHRIAMLFPPGTDLHVPPREFLNRGAYAIFTADDASTLATYRSRVVGEVELVGTSRAASAGVMA